jgi:hypothetical protein
MTDINNRNWFANDKLIRPDGKVWTFIGQDKGLLWFTHCSEEIGLTSREAYIARLEEMTMTNIKSLAQLLDKASSLQVEISKAKKFGDEVQEKLDELRKKL